MSLRNLLLIVLAMTLAFNVGCVAPATAHHGLDGDAAACGGHLDGHGHDGEAQETGHGETKALIYAFAGLAIVTVAFVDLLILPFTYHRPFPCCRGVLRLCH